jgi:hypothetical protein
MPKIFSENILHETLVGTRKRKLITCLSQDAMTFKFLFDKKTAPNLNLQKDK